MAKSKKTNHKNNSTNNNLIISAIVIIVLIMLLIVALLQAGIVGSLLNNIFRYLLGKFYIIYFISALMALIIKVFFNKKHNFHWSNIIGLIILNIALLLLFSSQSTNLVGFVNINNYLAASKEIFLGTHSVTYLGGLLGCFLYSLLSFGFDQLGTYIFIGGMFIIAIILLIPISYYQEIFHRSSNKKKVKKLKKVKPVMNEQLKTDESASNENQPKKTFNIIADDTKKNLKKIHPKKIIKEQEEIKEKVVKTVDVIDNQNYRLPPFSLLEPIEVNPNSKTNIIEMQKKGDYIVNILHNFGIESELIDVHIGPSVTKFEIKPDSSVKVNRVSNLQDNIKMELAARDVRIEAPIPGKNAVGIEVPNVHVTMVKMLEVIKNVPEKKQNNKLLFVLGKDLLGHSVFCELNKMPHLLIAGATGSGKSVCINTIITSLLLRTSPDEVKMLLIDPKKVEFMPYREIPHLIGPVISDPEEASRALKVIVLKMEERFELFSAAGVRNIASYNALVKNSKDDKLKPMPFIMVIIDELADLMMVAGKDVEASIQRITQLARASGIHLIVATQRPSTDVITGIIKSNIPSRISFSVASGIDSRTILDQVGAERLLGNGDMLYKPANLPSPIRIQGVYVSDNEVKSICEYVSKQAKPRYDDAFIRLDEVDNNQDKGIVSVQDDPIYQEAKEYVISVQKASTSLLQRHFGIGYNRAARVIDALEAAGVIGPQNGSKPRDVYIDK